MHLLLPPKMFGFGNIKRAHVRLRKYEKCKCSKRAKSLARERLMRTGIRDHVPFFPISLSPFLSIMSSIRRKIVQSHGTATHNFRRRPNFSHAIVYFLQLLQEQWRKFLPVERQVQ